MDIIKLLPSADEAITCDGLVEEWAEGALVNCIHDMPKFVE